MKVIVKDNFIGLYDENNEIQGRLDFKLVNGVLICMHTEVNPKLQGHGYAGLLFDKLIEFADENNYKINGLCSYVRNKLNTKDEYAKYRI